MLSLLFVLLCLCTYKIVQYGYFLQVCYSVAPITMLTKKVFDKVNSNSLVAVFLGTNAVVSEMEPAILGSLRLRRTIVVGAMFLMFGSIIKSSGLKSIMMSSKRMILEELLEEEDSTWQLYLGFFMAGLSQPLYQCTLALLSTSWFSPLGTWCS